MAVARKNYIQRLQSDLGWVTLHTEKEDTIQKHFKETLAPPAPRNTNLNWEVLNSPAPDLHNLQNVFTETEVFNTLDQL